MRWRSVVVVVLIALGVISQLFEVQRIHYDLPEQEFAAQINNSTYNDGMRNLSIVLLIPSVPQKSQDRHILRRTWLNNPFTPGVTVTHRFFVLIQSDSTYLVEMFQEADKYADLLMETSEVRDNVLLNTVKLVSMLKWAHRNLPDADAVFVVEPDIFVNLNFLAAELATYLEDPLVKAGQRHLYFGQSAEPPFYVLRSSMTAARAAGDAASIMFSYLQTTSYSDWPMPTYPPYMVRGFFGFSSQLAWNLVGSMTSDHCSLVPGQFNDQVTVGIQIADLQKHGLLIDFITPPSWALSLGLSKGVNLPNKVTVLHALPHIELRRALFTHLVQQGQTLKKCETSKDSVSFIKEPSHGWKRIDSPVHDIFFFEFQDGNKLSLCYLQHDNLPFFENLLTTLDSSYSSPALLATPQACYIENPVPNQPFQYLNNWTWTHFETEVKMAFKTVLFPPPKES